MFSPIAFFSAPEETPTPSFTGGTWIFGNHGSGTTRVGNMLYSTSPTASTMTASWQSTFGDFFDMEWNKWSKFAWSAVWDKTIANNSNILTSTNSTTWRTVTVSGLAAGYSGKPAMGPTISVQFRYNGQQMVYTSDGLNFTASTISVISPSNSDIRATAYNETTGRYVAVVRNQATSIYYSDNGLNWTGTAAGGSADWGQITSANGIFIRWRAGNILQTSTDGINWVSRTIGVTPSWLTYSPTLNRWVGVGVNILVTSDDNGETWTTRTPISNDGSSIGIAWSEEYAVFVATRETTTTTNELAWSSDGINWTRFTPTSNKSTNSYFFVRNNVAFAPGLLTDFYIP